MQIGRAAAEAGVSVKAIRHWEEEGLLPELPRRGRYRHLDAGHVQRLRLIAHCRRLGFSIEGVRQILELLPSDGCPDPVAMRELVTARLSAVRREIAALRSLEDRLTATDVYLAQRVLTLP